MAIAAPPAHAATTAGDLLIAARVLGFMENGPKGNVTVGIVHDPSKSQSLKDAEGIRQLLGNGLKVGNLVLTPVMVKIDEIAAAKTDLFLLTEGMSAEGTNLAAIKKSKHVACVTVDLAQVRKGACVIGVQSRPKVEILVNRQAAADSGIAFSAVFRMMITEF